MKKSIIEATALIKLYTLLQNRTLGVWWKVTMNIGFIRSCVVAWASGPTGEEDIWLIVNTTLYSSLLFAAPVNP